jgi:hypothetical protein
VRIRMGSPFSPSWVKFAEFEFQFEFVSSFVLRISNFVPACPGWV